MDNLGSQLVLRIRRHDSSIGLARQRQPHHATTTTTHCINHHHTLSSRAKPRDLGQCFARSFQDRLKCLDLSAHRAGRNESPPTCFGTATSSPRRVLPFLVQPPLPRPVSTSKRWVPRPEYSRFHFLKLVATNLVIQGNLHRDQPRTRPARHRICHRFALVLCCHRCGHPSRVARDPHRRPVM